jgi:hypothetical protein
MQRSILGVVNIFMGAPSIGRGDEIQMDRATLYDRALIFACPSVSRMVLGVNTDAPKSGKDTMLISVDKHPKTSRLSLYPACS